MNIKDEMLKRIWRQGKIPVLFRRPRPEPILVRLPFSSTNREWVQEGHKRKTVWNGKYTCWEAPVAWFDDLVDRAIHKYGSVYVIQPFNRQQKCAPACWNAKGYECECSCMGLNHGNGEPAGNWKEISESLAVNYGAREYSCRLLNI